MRFLFEGFVLDLDRRELLRGAELIAVGPQVFDLLVFLVQNRERMVSKDDVLDSVWSGRVVSESTLTSHINAVRKAIGDSGEEQKLIRTIARKGFRFVGEVTEEKMPVGTGGAAKSAPDPASDVTPPARVLPLPDKPSVAVLPFENLGGDPEQEYFADGMVEDIITALSRMRWLFVIARNSSFTYKGRAVDVKQVGRELGVRYIVEGGVRKAANRVRITAQLIDAATGANIWADRFDGGIEDIFDLQDRMTESIVGAVAPTLEQAEIDRATRKPTENLDAYDLHLRGMARFYQRTNEANTEALRLFGKAIELDPELAVAYGMAAWCYVWRKQQGWMTDREHEITEGGRLARRAVELGKDDPIALARGGHALGFLLGDLDSAAAFLDRALMLNPNLATVWYLSGWIRAYRGEPDRAIEHLAQTMRLSPRDPNLYRVQTGTGLAHFLAGRYEDAVSWSEKAFLSDPSYVLSSALVLAASSALAGRLEQARRAVQRVREVDPALRVAKLLGYWPIRQPEHQAKWAEGLRKAGLPE